MEMILHAPSAMPESPKPCGRTIKPETEDIAAKHQGKCLISGVLLVCGTFLVCGMCDVPMGLFYVWCLGCVLRMII